MMGIMKKQLIKKAVPASARPSFNLIFTREHQGVVHKEQSDLFQGKVGQMIFLGLKDQPIAITVINFGLISHNGLFLLGKFFKIDANESTFAHQTFGDNGETVQNFIFPVLIGKFIISEIFYEPNCAPNRFKPFLTHYRVRRYRTELG